MKVAVIGSGPAAFATVAALLTESEYQITIFDAGVNSDKSELVTSIVGEKRSAGIKKNIKMDSKSDLDFFWDGKPRNLLPSNQLSGGWSKYWGATVLENNHLPKQEVTSHFQSIAWKKLLEYLPSQGEVDSFAKRFQLLGNETMHGEISGVAESLLRKFESRFENENMIIFGKSRLAINPLSFDIRSGCISCSRCLSGCPKEHIFNSWNALIKLQEEFGQKRLNFYDDGYVTRFAETSTKAIEIETIDGIIHKDYDKLYIAAGSVGTATLLLRSTGLNKISIFETPMTIIPSIYLGGKTSRMSKITLSEIFMAQIDKDCVTSAGQIYSFNNELVDIILNRFKLVRLKCLLPAWLQSRIIFCMFFIPPTNSSEFEVRSGLNQSVVEFRGKYRFSEFKEHLVSYAKQMKKLRFLTIPILSYRPPKGSSYHFGNLHLRQIKNSTLIRKDGTLNCLGSDSQIFCVGSSGFEVLIPGPITLDIMIQSQIVTRKSLERDGK